LIPVKKFDSFIYTGRRATRSKNFDVRMYAGRRATRSKIFDVRMYAGRRAIRSRNSRAPCTSTRRLCATSRGGWRIGEAASLTVPKSER
jgi:hypothetical protein